MALAAFMRAGYLWAVLDGVAAGGGMADIPEALAETVFMAERIGHNTVTAVRFRLADGVFPAINLNADGWTIDLDLEPAAPAHRFGSPKHRGPWAGPDFASDPGRGACGNS